MSIETNTFGPYRLDELLGRGGMGEVYRAFDREHERTVAVKRLAPHLADDAEFQRRFRREARVAAQLRSPHVIPIHRYGQIAGQLYIDMRFVDGGDLHDLIQATGGLDLRRAVEVLEQIAHAVDDAHANGLVHRDVKPSNILLDTGVRDFCYLADFGVTRAAAASTTSNSLTRTGALLGSLAYMAPEQFDGAVTKQSDVYSLTCVFFEAITGDRPYAGEGLPALMHQHLKIPPPRPSDRNPDAAIFDELVATGMSKEVGTRFNSAGELARAARSALDTHRSARTTAAGASPVPPPPVPQPPVPPPPVPPPPVPPPPVPPPASPLPVLPRPVSVRPASPRPASPPPLSPPAAKAEPAPDGHRPGDDHADPAADRADRYPRAAAVSRVPSVGTDAPTEDLRLPVAAPPPRPSEPARRRLLPVGIALAVLTLLAGTWVIAGRGGADPNPAATGSTAAPSAAALSDAGSAAAPGTIAAPAPPTVAEAVFTGRSSGDGLAVAVGVKDGRAVGFLSDGNTVEAWLEGTLVGDQLTLHGLDAGTAVTATVGPQSVLGEVTVGGTARPFSAPIATGPAGLFGSRRTVEGTTTRIGWIVLSDGTQVGVRDRNGERSPAPPLNPLTLIALEDGRPIPVLRLSGASVVLDP